MALGTHLLAQWTDALRFPRGGIRLVALRFGLLVACFLPGRFALKGRLEAALGGNPSVADAAAPDVLALIDALTQDGALGVALLLAGGFLFFVFDQLLTATALTIADPHRGGAPPHVWRTAWDEGVRFFVRFVRVALVGLAMMGLAGFLVSTVTKGWARGDGYVASTGQYRVWTVQFARVALGFSAVALVGAWTFWARVLIVADARRGVLRAYGDALRVLWRAPISAYGMFVGVSAAVVAGLGRLWVALIGPDAGGALLWTLLLLVQCTLWFWCLHAGRLLYAHADINDIASGAGRSLYSLVRRRG